MAIAKTSNKTFRNQRRKFRKRVEGLANSHRWTSEPYPHPKASLSDT